MKILSTLVLTGAALANCQTPVASPAAAEVKEMRVVAANIIWEGILTRGIRVIGVINGQPVVLREFKGQSNRNGHLPYTSHERRKASWVGDGSALHPDLAGWEAAELLSGGRV